MCAQSDFLQQLSLFADRTLQRNRFLVMTGFIAVVALGDISFGQVREIEVGCHAGDLKRYSWDDLGYSASYLATAVDRKTAKRKTSFQMRVGPPDLESRFHMYFPLSAEGDIVPMFGTTCQVGVIYANSILVDVGIPEFGQCDGILKMASIKLADPNIKVPSNCLTIPNGGRVSRFDKTWQTGFYRLDVESIFEREGTPFAKLKISVVNFRGIQRKTEPGVSKSIELKVLDRLEVAASYRVFIEGEEVFRDREHFRVKHIVLPDLQKHVIGWVSLEPTYENWSKPPNTK